MSQLIQTVSLCSRIRDHYMTIGIRIQSFRSKPSVPDTHYGLPDFRGSPPKKMPLVSIFFIDFLSPRSSDRHASYITGSRDQTGGSMRFFIRDTYKYGQHWSENSGLPGHICREGPHAFQEVGTIAALHILHDHAEVFPGLEAAVHGHHEGIVGEGHDVPLGKDLLHLHIWLPSSNYLNYW